MCQTVAISICHGCVSLVWISGALSISLLIPMITSNVAAALLQVPLLQLLLLLPIALVANVQITLIFVLQCVVSISMISFIYWRHTLHRIWIGSIHQALLRWHA